MKFSTLLLTLACVSAPFAAHAQVHADVAIDLVSLTCSGGTTMTAVFRVEGGGGQARDTRFGLSLPVQDASEVSSVNVECTTSYCSQTSSSYFNPDFCSWYNGGTNIVYLVCGDPTNAYPDLSLGASGELTVTVTMTNAYSYGADGYYKILGNAWSATPDSNTGNNYDFMQISTSTPNCP